MHVAKRMKMMGHGDKATMTTTTVAFLPPSLMLILLLPAALPLLLMPGSAEATTITTTTTAGQNVKVNAVSLSGKALNMWVAVRDGGTTTVKAGFTPFAFSTAAAAGSSPAPLVVVRVADYGSYVFDHWENGSTSRYRTVSAADSVMTAYYREGAARQTYSLTVKSVALDDSGSELSGMWATVRPGGSAATTTTTTTVVKSGYTPFTYVGGAGTYSLTASDYGQYLFSHWEDGSTERTRTVSIGPDAASSTTTTAVAVAYYKKEAV